MKYGLLLFICIILFTSCGHIPQNYLLYQDFPLELDAVMTFGGMRYDVYMSVTGVGEGTLIYKTPLTLADYRYDVTGDGVTVTYERLTVELTEGSYHPSKAAVNLFTLTQDEMRDAELVEHGGVKLNRITYERENDTVTVWITSDNQPVRIESETISLDIINFKGNMQNE